MCFKIGDNEFETVRGLMTMTVYSIISDTLGVSLESIEPESHLVNDLGMDLQKQEALKQSIKEMFDELTVEITPDSRVQDLVDMILLDEFDEIEYSEMDYFEPVV